MTKAIGSSAPEAAANMAAGASQGRGATVAVEAMQFPHPVKVGEKMALCASLRKTRRTSIRIHVDVWSRSKFEKDSQKVTDANMVFVALKRFEISLRHIRQP